MQVQSWFENARCFRSMLKWCVFSRFLLIGLFDWLIDSKAHMIQKPMENSKVESVDWLIDWFHSLHNPEVNGKLQSVVSWSIDWLIP